MAYSMFVANVVDVIGLARWLSLPDRGPFVLRSLFVMKLVMKMKKMMMMMIMMTLLLHIMAVAPVPRLC